MIFRHGLQVLTLPDELAALGMEPLEQGGILIGAHDFTGAEVRQFTRPGPLDLRLPGLFMLLDPGHEEQLHRSGLGYLGFWHSHPAGTPSKPSTEDLLDWRHSAAQLFPQLDTPHLYFPIITGDRLRVWALDRDLTLTELEVTECST